MNILITGSSGFIGSNLANLFRGQGHMVSNLNRLQLSNNECVIELFKTSEIIINCIGSANVGFSYSNTGEDFESNVVVVRGILELLREYKLNHIKFINLSSAAVYGNPIKLPIRDTDSTQPLSPYGFHKLMAELLLKEYSQCFGLKTISLRIFSAYGKGQKKLLLWDLHEKIQTSTDKIVLYGTGNESRDFIHIDDIAQQILLAIEHSDFNGIALNVANGVEVKISDVIELYQKFYPKKINYEFNGEVRLGDPLNWCADISTMQNWGYKQRVYLIDGIKSMIEWASNQ